MKKKIYSKKNDGKQKKKRKEKKRKEKVKPSATQIFRSDSPPTVFLLLGSCVFIGFLSWVLIPMHYVVDFKVDWLKLLFKSRPQLPCRDIIHVATSISCRDINLNLCSLQLMSTDVATSIPCRDITLCPCRFQLITPDVATSFSCRDISSSLLQASDGCSGRRDINLLS